MPVCPMCRMLAAGLLTVALGLCAGCASDGHLNLFGYTTAPTYDCDIRTVYVPIFDNVSFRRGLEFDLTRAVVREIEAKTPYKVVNCRDKADTELIGKIVGRRKQLINVNQLGETRDAEVVLAVELQWNDLRPGHLGESLSRAENASKEDPLSPNKLDPYAPRGKKAKDPNIILVQPTTHFIPELGGSVASAERQLIDRLAVQIVSMMEKW